VTKEAVRGTFQAQEGVEEVDGTVNIKFDDQASLDDIAA